MEHIQKIEKARFDGQLPVEQKQYFEQAAALGGFRTLTEFVFLAAQEKAEQIVKEHKTILSSQRDRDVFFEALVSPPIPNEKLKSAAEKYNDELES